MSEYCSQGCSLLSMYNGATCPEYILKEISFSAVALYMHRFLENSLAPAFAKLVLGISAWSQIVVGGSNFGEVGISFLHGFILMLMISPVIGGPLCACAIRYCHHPCALVAFGRPFGLS